MDGSPFHRLVTVLQQWLRTRRLRRLRARFTLIDGARSWFPSGSSAVSRRLPRASASLSVMSGGRGR